MAVLLIRISLILLLAEQVVDNQSIAQEQCEGMIAFNTYGDSLFVMGADGSNLRLLVAPGPNMANRVRLNLNTLSFEWAGGPLQYAAGHIAGYGGHVTWFARGFPGSSPTDVQLLAEERTHPWQSRAMSGLFYGSYSYDGVAGSNLFGPDIELTL